MPIPDPDKIAIRSFSLILPEFRKLKRDILASLTSNSQPIDVFDRLTSIIFKRVSPELISTLSDSMLSTWILGTDHISRNVPKWTTPAFTIPKIPEGMKRAAPGLQVAIRNLSDRRILSNDTFLDLSEEARRTAQTIIGIKSVKTMEKIRDAIVEDLHTGDTLRNFRIKIAKVLDDEAPLRPNVVEAIYRNQVGQAYSAAQRFMLNHPLVGDEFPYVLYSATHDTRVRPTHLRMESWGPDGGRIYRADDPIWETLWPPSEWNCRCNCIMLSLKNAARLGSKEAQAWIKSKRPPLYPQYAKTPYPIIPPVGWPTHERIAPVVAA